MELHFLEPFAPDDHRKGGRKLIAAKARAMIEAELARALGKPPRDFAHDVAPVRYKTKPTPDDPPT